MTVPGVSCKALATQTALNGPVPRVPSPLAQACGGEDILYIYIFLIFPGHLEFWTPLQILSWGPPLGCTLLQSLLSDIQPLYNHIKDNGRRSRLLVTTSSWTWMSSYLTLGQGCPERGCSMEGVLPVRGRTSQNPSQLAVTAKLQTQCPKAGITGKLASFVVFWR